MDSRTERSASPADEGKGLSGAGLSPDLAAETAVDLPDREAMSTISGNFGDGIDNFAMPINTAEAANLYSDGSMAVADADQVVILDQVDYDGEPSETPDRGPSRR